jgi:hypothetical protein
MENVGPIERVALDLPFASDGNPKPTILVGENGTGKIILLSQIADALMEFAADHYADILPHQGPSRKYFKIAGGINQAIRKKYGFSFLQFSDGERSFQYLDKTGNLSPEDLRATVEIPITVSIPNDDKTIKEHTRDPKYFEREFQNNVFVFFPANRAERPHWLNPDIPESESFSTAHDRWIDRLEKPIICNSSAKKNRDWLLDVLLDQHLYGDYRVMVNANRIVKSVLLNDFARFGIGSRSSGARVGIAEDTHNGPQLIVPSINGLSSGQATLLNLFLTIIRYADSKNSSTLADIIGIVVVDEADAHLHTSLLRDTLPSLIKLFPKVQFILTTHSPVLLLGMEKHCSTDGFQVLEMPSARNIMPKDFSEYAEVVEALDLQAALRNSKSDVVLLVEGATDKLILENAWKALNKSSLPFEIVNAFDCFFIQNTMMREDAFRNSPEKTFIGLLDFDKAFDCWERVSQKDKSHTWQLVDNRSERDGLALKHKDEKGFLCLLPVPDSRAVLASREFGKNSCVSIELLFDNDLLQGFIQEKKLPGGGMILVFKDEKKQQFAELSGQFTPEQFKYFTQVFKMIEELAPPPPKDQTLNALAGDIQSGLPIITTTLPLMEPPTITR